MWQRMSQQTRSGQQQPPPPSYTCSQTMPRVPPHHVSHHMSSQTLQHVRPPAQSPYLYQDQSIQFLECMNMHFQSDKILVWTLPWHHPFHFLSLLTFYSSLLLVRSSYITTINTDP